MAAVSPREHFPEPGRSGEPPGSPRSPWAPPSPGAAGCRADPAPLLLSQTLLAPFSARKTGYQGFVHLPRCLRPIAAAGACARRWPSAAGWDLGRGSRYRHPTPCGSSFGFDPGANRPAWSKTGLYTPVCSWGGQELWVLPGLPAGSPPRAGWGGWMLLEQDPPAWRMGSLLGKEHWGEQDRGLLLARVFCHTGQGPLRLARTAQGHPHPTTALRPHSSGQPPRTFLLPAVPSRPCVPSPGPACGRWSCGWQPPGTRGAWGLLPETGLNSLWLWLWLLGDK